MEIYRAMLRQGQRLVSWWQRTWPQSADDEPALREYRRALSILDTMTMAERGSPANFIDSGRLRRIARGAGVADQDGINLLFSYGDFAEQVSRANYHRPNDHTDPTSPTGGGSEGRPRTPFAEMAPKALKNAGSGAILCDPLAIASEHHCLSRLQTNGAPRRIWEKLRIDPLQIHRKICDVSRVTQDGKFDTIRSEARYSRLSTTHDFRQVVAQAMEFAAQAAHHSTSTAHLLWALNQLRNPIMEQAVARIGTLIDDISRAAERWLELGLSESPWSSRLVGNRSLTAAWERT